MGEGKADSIDNYMDSDCTENVLCPQNHFTSQKKVAPVKVGNIGKEPVIVTRRGTTNIVGTNGRGKPINFELKNSLISETLINKNLISARRIADAGHTIVIGRGAGGASKMRIITGNVKVSGGEIISESTRDANGLYPIRPPRSEAEHKVQSNFTMTRGLHRRMGHTGKALEVTAKEFFTLVGPRQLQPCDPCMKRKIKRSPVLATAHFDQDLNIGEEWNADLFYLKTKTFGGRRWALVCTDTKSKMSRIFLLFKKNEQFRAFLDMIPWSETQTGNKVRFFRSD